MGQGRCRGRVGRCTLTISMCLPIPVLVIPRPPKIMTASSAISAAIRVENILRKAICLGWAGT